MENFTMAELGVFGLTINCCGVICKRKVDRGQVAEPQPVVPEEVVPNP